MIKKWRRQDHIKQNMRRRIIQANHLSIETVIKQRPLITKVVMMDAVAREKDKIKFVVSM